LVRDARDRVVHSGGRHRRLRRRNQRRRAAESARGAGCAECRGALWPALGLDERAAASVSGYLFVSGLTSAAVRLGAIGAIEAQRVLGGALPLIAELLEQPVPEPAGAVELTGFTPLIEIAAMRQAQAELRLFAN
jgi:urease accessory protein